MLRRTWNHAAQHPHAAGALVALVALLTAAATWLWAHEGHQPLPSKGAQIDPTNPSRLILTREARVALDVQTAEAEPRAVEERVLAYATLTAPWQRHAYVTTRLPGRVEKLLARPGDKVAAGQRLVEIASPELRNLPQEVRTAQNNIALSERVAGSLEALSGSGAVRAQDLYEARTKLEQDRNALEIARSKWLSLGLGRPALEELLARPGPDDAGRTLPIASPIPGVVIHADVAVGEVVEPTTHLLEILDLSRVWVKIGALEKDVPRVRVGQPVELTLTAYPGEVFRTTVQVKGVALDPQTHLGAVWAELENPAGQEPRFLPGMNGQAHLIEPAGAKALTVPAAAIVTDGAERYVLVEETETASGTQYLRKPVVVGRRAGDRVEIRGGDVFPGDRVVTQGSHEMAGFFVQGVLRLSPEAVRNIGLVVEPAGRHVVEEIVEVDGQVDLPPDRRTVAASQLPGAIQRIRVGPGEAVRAGQVIAEVASLELQTMQLKLLRTALEGKLLEGSLRRARAAGQALPERKVWELESQHNNMKIELETARQQLETVGLTPEQIDGVLTGKGLVEAMPLRAPRDGIVVRFNKVLGEAIKADEPLFEIHDLSTGWVQGFLSEQDFARVRIGQPARVRLDADPTFLAEGTVVRSSRVFGAENRTLAVWVELTQPPPRPLQHNQLARLALVVRRPAAALAVPPAAVVAEGMRSFVFVQDPDGAFRRQEVRPGRADDRRVEIVQGLQPGQPVAVRGTAGLQTAYASIR